MSNTKLRLNGYGTDAAGRLVCYRTPAYRYEHEQLAAVHLIVGDSKAAKDFAAKVIAALDEPAALVGVGASGAVMLFRPASKNTYVKYEFIFEGKQGLLVATIEGATPIDVSELDWRNGRSPLTVPCTALPPLFDDIVEKAARAVTEFGAMLGALPTAEEIAAEAARKERLAKIAADIAAGMYTDEAIAAREDEQLATSMPADISLSDGILAQNVIAARVRVARRKAAAEAARVAALTPEQRAEERQAREDAAVVERHKDSKITEADGEYAARIVQVRARHAARQRAQAVAT